MVGGHHEFVMLSTALACLLESGLHGLQLQVGENVYSVFNDMEASCKPSVTVLCLC